MTLSGNHCKEPEASWFPHCSQPICNHPDRCHLLLNERVSTRTWAPRVRGEQTGSWEGGAGAGSLVGRPAPLPIVGSVDTRPQETHEQWALLSWLCKAGTAQTETEERGPHTHSRKGAPLPSLRFPRGGTQPGDSPAPSAPHPTLKSSVCIKARLPRSHLHTGKPTPRPPPAPARF